MKLTKQSFQKDASGFVTLVATDKEDLWALYNLIQKDDVIKMKTTRNVKKSSGKEGGSKAKTERKVMTLSIKVENVEFTASDEVMRLRGRTTEPNDDVPVGSYHTAELEFHLPFTLTKTEWDQVAYDIITKACSVEEKAEVGAIIMDEGIAHICLITENMTILRNKVEKSIPKKKRGDNSAYEKSYDKFLKMTYDSMLRHFNFDKLKVVIIASPGFVNKRFYDFAMKQLQLETDKTLLANRSKFVVAHSSTGYLQGLEEALKTPELQKSLSDTKFRNEVLTLEEFLEVLNKDDSQAYYGKDEVEKAVRDHVGSVKTLLITDTLFRNDDVAVRRYYIDLTEQVKSTGGDVVVFSSLHDSGVQLDELTGVAVILRFPVPGLDDDDDE